MSNKARNTYGFNNLLLPGKSALIKKVFLLFILIQALSVTSGYSQLNLSYYLDRGRQMLYFYKYSQAIEQFNIVIDHSPDSPEAFFLRAIAKYNLGDFYGAEKDYSKTIEIKPNAAKAYYYRGMTRIQLYNFNGAIDDFNRTIDFVNPDSELFIQRGFCNFKLENYQHAIEDFNKAIQHKEKSKKAYYFRGIARLSIKDTTRAIGDLTTAIRYDSTYIDAYINRGRIYSLNKDYEKALADLNRAIEIDPNSSRALINRSMVYDHMQKLEKAMNDLDHIIEIEPTNALAYYNRALLRTEIGAYNKAIDDYNQVLKYNPQNILSYFNRGVVQMQRDAYGKAIRDFTLAINLYPNFAKAYINRSIARRKLDDIQGAYQDRQKAEEIFAEYRNNQLEQINFADTSENFRRLISIQGSRNLPQQFGNLNESIEPFNNFSLYYTKENKQNIIKTLEKYTEKKELQKRFEFLDEEFIFDFDYNSSASSEELSEKATILAEKIKEHPDSINLRFKFALFKGYTKNYNDAIQAINEIIESGEESFISYFIRANLRSKMIEYIKMLKDDSRIINIDIDNKLMQEPISNEVTYHDYSKVIKDYNKSVQLAPKFVYTYYNRANVKIENKNYQGALSDYNKAIYFEPKFAEAFFNRGLTYIYLQKTDKGCIDLSKAGELGIEKAYTVIKLYCK